MDARSKRWPLIRVAVAEHSMEPALRPGDWLLAWRTRRVRPGRLVLAWHPQRPGFLLVKRAAWREEGGWWLSADNPAAGAVDSARFGPVPEEKIVAVVLVRYWPPRLSRPLSRVLSRTGACFAPQPSAEPRPPACGERGSVLAGKRPDRRVTAQAVMPPPRSDAMSADTPRCSPMISSISWRGRAAK